VTRTPAQLAAEARQRDALREAERRLHLELDALRRWLSAVEQVPGRQEGIGRSVTALLAALRSYLDASGRAGVRAPELRERTEYASLCLLCGDDRPEGFTDCDELDPCRWCGSLSSAYVDACSDCAAAGIEAGRLRVCPDPCGGLVPAGEPCPECGGEEEK